MKKNKCSFVKKVLLGLVCVLFFLGSATPALSAPKKPKKDKTDSTATAESPTAGTLEIVLEPNNAQREIGGKVRVHIYADPAASLISMGVKVTFDPAVLQVNSAEKYEAFADGWVMDADGSDSSTDDQYTTPAVEIDNTSPSGTVTMIGGRLMGSSTTGLPITGTRVLLGWIVFEAIDYGTSNLNVYLAKYHSNHDTDTFDNFVQVDGTVDEPNNVPGDLGTICVLADACTGTINENDSVDMGDFSIIRAAMGTSFPSSGYNLLADLNGNGTVDMADFSIVRAEMGASECPSCPAP